MEYTDLFMPMSPEKWASTKQPKKCQLFSIFILLSTVSNNKFSNITFLALLYAHKTKETKFTDSRD